ncbi:MAG: response regulator transcription factor [Pseudomonadota bacterium]
MAKIVVIEDEPELRELIVDELEDAGHHAVEASDGVEGLAAIKAENPDMIISDIGMPRMDGYELRRRLQGCARFSDTPFMFLSAYPPQNALAEGIDVGAVNYFTKPVDFGSLLARIETITI